MRQIFKNYLATFIKNWLQTIGTILFILMMFAVVIGFLAAPLQIYAKVKSMDNKNIKFTQETNQNDFKYNSEFLYKFLYDHKDNTGNVFYQKDSKTGVNHEVLREDGLNDNQQQLLSNIFHDAVDLDASNKIDVEQSVGANNQVTTTRTVSPITFTSDQDKYDAYANYLRPALFNYEDGALVKTNINFALGFGDKDDANVTDNENAFVSEYADDIQGLIANVFNTEPNADQDGAMKSRGFAIINAVLGAAGSTKTATDLANYMAGTNDDFVKLDENSAKVNQSTDVLTINTANDEGWRNNNPKNQLIAGYNEEIAGSTPFNRNTILINGNPIDAKDEVEAKEGATIIKVKLTDQEVKDAISDGIAFTTFRNGKSAIKPAKDGTATSVDPSQNTATGTAQSTQQFGDSTVDLIRMDMRDRGSTYQNVNLIADQIFYIPKVSNPGAFYDGNGLYNKLASSTYSNNFLNYIARLALMDQNNTNAYTNGNQNYKFSIEKSMFFSQTSSSSLFPTMSVVLKTVNQPNETNQIQLESGRLPTKFTYNYENRQDILDEVMKGQIVPEIVINSGYASHNHLKLGDMITLPDGPEHNNVSTLVGANSSDDWLTNLVKYKIVGIGEKFDDATPGAHYTPFMEKIDTYTNAYVDDGWFDILKDAKWNNSSSSTSDFESTIRITNAKGVKADPVNVFNFNYGDKNANNGVYNISKNPFTNYSDTSTMRSVNNTKIRVIIFIILGVAVLVLAFIFINFIITKELNETRRQIGIFKSFGYKISELSWIFAVKTFLTIFVGALFGWLVSLAIQSWSAGNYMDSVMFHFDKMYSGAAFLCIILIVIPVIFLALSYFMTLFYLAEPTLSLLANGSKVKKGTTHVSPLLKHLAKTGKGFGYRLQKGFIKDSMGKFVVVQILFAIASLTFTLMFGAQSLMFGIADQGFAVLNKNANHAYYWDNQDEINIGYNQSKYSLNDEAAFQKRDFKYTPYTGNQKIGDVLNKSKDMSDSRYRENFLVGAISHTFDVNKSEAMEMLMPLDYYLVKTGGVTPADLPQKLKDLNITDPNLVAAAGQDKNIPVAMAGQEMAYHDYYLNWILSFRISSMPENNRGNVIGMKTIKDELIKGKKFNLQDLRDYVKDWGNSKTDPIKLDMTDIVSDPGTVRTQFMATLFGLSAENSAGQKNNLFLADITKIITLELAENYAISIFNNQMAADTPTSTNQKTQAKIYKSSDVYNGIQKVKQDSLWKDFSPDNAKYWGMQNNPLMTSMLNGSASSNSGSKTGVSTANGGGGGLSLSKMNPQTISLIMAASMLGINDGLQDMPTITINQAFFNKEEDALFYNLPVTGLVDNYNTKLSLFDFTDTKYGVYDKLLTHKGVSDATYKELADDSGQPGTVNAVIPYVLAKTKKIKVGDTITASTDTKQKVPVKLHVIGINKSVTYSLSAWSIDVDYNQFAKQFFSPKLYDQVNDKDGNQPLFNEMMSTQPMMEGGVNLSDIASSIDKMKFVGRDLSMSIDPDASVFGSIFEGMVDFSTLLGSKVDASYRLITNPNIASTSPYSSVDPFNILRAGVNNGINMVNNILIVFMVLVAVMLLIILVVVMNIIVEQATPIILTLKSLGYNQREINWITMGSYITGAIISFVVAYCFSLIVWNVFLAIAGDLWHIYVFMTYSWKAPVITFLVVGAILAFGWYVSDRKVERIPLAMVTGFN